jgi:hypothetical protein
VFPPIVHGPPLVVIETEVAPVVMTWPATARFAFTVSTPVPESVTWA